MMALVERLAPVSYWNILGPLLRRSADVEKGRSS
jgi:hypothetical protein